MGLPMLMHDLCFMHIACMFAAYGLQARMPHRGVVLVLSVMLCSEGLKKVQVPGNPCSVHSCHLLSQHDPPWPRGPIVVPQKFWSPVNPQLLLQGPRVHCKNMTPLLVHLHVTSADCTYYSVLLVPAFISSFQDNLQILFCSRLLLLLFFIPRPF